MKRVPLIILCILNAAFISAQTKKDLEQSIFTLEEKQRNTDNQIAVLKNEVTSLQTNVKVMNEIITTLTKDNEELMKLVTSQTKMLQQLSHTNDSLLIAQKIKEKQNAIILPKTEGDSIIALIQSFQSCRRWEDRARFVLNADRLMPVMASYYTDNYRSYDIPKENIYLQGSNYKVGDVFKVLCNNTLFYCKKTDSGFYIDWEASTGYNPTSIKAFKAGIHNPGTAYRVTVELDSYYNFSFVQAQSTHWSIHIKADETLAGYILKNSADGKRLYEILADGNPHDLILELSPDPEGTYSNIAVITKIVDEDWSRE